MPVQRSSFQVYSTPIYDALRTSAPAPPCAESSGQQIKAREPLKSHTLSDPNTPSHPKWMPPQSLFQDPHKYMPLSLLSPVRASSAAGRATKHPDGEMTLAIPCSPRKRRHHILDNNSGIQKPSRPNKQLLLHPTPFDANSTLRQRVTPLREWVRRKVSAEKKENILPSTHPSLVAQPAPSQSQSLSNTHSSDSHPNRLSISNWHFKCGDALWLSRPLHRSAPATIKINETDGSTRAAQMPIIPWATTLGPRSVHWHIE